MSDGWMFFNLWSKVAKRFDVPGSLLDACPWLRRKDRFTFKNSQPHLVRHWDSVPSWLGRTLGYILMSTIRMTCLLRIPLGTDEQSLCDLLGYAVRHSRQLGQNASISVYNQYILVCKEGLKWLLAWYTQRSTLGDGIMVALFAERQTNIHL